MGDLSYWDPQGQRFTPRGVAPSATPVTPARRSRPARPPRSVVRQLLALFDS
jgi:hypothetical protein